MLISELTDPIKQHQHLEAQAARKAAGDLEAQGRTKTSIAILLELQTSQPSETRFLEETGFLGVRESFRTAMGV